MSLVHPEQVGNRTLWVDSVMDDLIRKLHYGDPVIGWEGDERLAVYAVNEPDGIVWEIVRLEDDNEYRPVMRSAPGVRFDERVLHKLCEWDTRRRQRDLHREIAEHNAKIDADKEAHRNEWVAEELAPRLRKAMMKDAGW